MKLEGLEVYNLAMSIGEKIWEIAAQWDYFFKKTVGDQLVRSADSIAANISEGYGRFHYQENKHFCYYARGSLMETKTWLEKSKNRNMISQEEYDSLNESLEILHKKLNNYIRSIGPQKNVPMTNDH
ncbi:MAG: four helix bundle protein [Nitrospinae bacterium]|nr:four helix bundle protein [Nitrospinota bacterium]